MFSLIHYFPRASFTGLLLPHTHHIFKELKTNKNSNVEVLNIHNYIAYLRRTNKYSWNNQSFVNNFNITSVIQNNNDQLFIREQIGVTIKNHMEFNIALDYSLELLDDLKHNPITLLTINNYKYIPTVNNINTPILTNIYTKDILEQYNQLNSCLKK
jgi:hypothetical protein